MSMPYPEHAVYERLYARYFQGERTRQMLRLAGGLDSKNVVDLCGGGGRLSALARRAGANVTLVDESPAMASSAPAGVTVVYRDVRTWLASFCGREEYDALFCQQAVNYWLSPDIVDDLAEVLKPGGRFIFNTFNRQPGTVPAVKQYELDGVSFVEASWMSADDTVEHVQMREGEPPHTTRFKWISPAQFQQWLSPRFLAQEKVDGASSIWVCQRK